MKPRPSPSRARNRYNTAGLCSAFAVVPSDSLRRRFRRAAAGVLPDMSLFGLEATAAAYARGGAWRARLLEYLRANEQAARAHLAANLPELAVDAAPLESTYTVSARRRSRADEAQAHRSLLAGTCSGSTASASSR